jgi:molybdenum cofactor biosynthesis protein B
LAGAPESHRHEAPKRQLRYVVITVSTSRFKKKGSVPDESGDLAQRIVQENHGRVTGRKLIPDDLKQLRSSTRAALRDDDVDVVLFTGGTGVSSTDTTIEAVRPFFEKEIEGFGELFRRVSYDRIGPAAALSRATAGLVGGKLVVCLPGSPDAVRTGLELFISEFPHVLYLARGR